MELENEEELSLLSLSDNSDRSWRLNFESFQFSSEHTEKMSKPSRGIHDCYGVLGEEDRKQTSTNYQFGLFAPAFVSKSGTSENTKAVTKSTSG